MDGWSTRAVLSMKWQPIPWARATARKGTATSAPVLTTLSHSPLARVRWAWMMFTAAPSRSLGAVSRMKMCDSSPRSDRV